MLLRHVFAAGVALAAMTAASLLAEPDGWSAVQRWAASRRGALAAADRGCPPLVPVAVGGAAASAARPDYAAVFAAVEGVPELARDFGRCTGTDGTVVIAPGDDEALAALAPAFAALAAAAAAPGDLPADEVPEVPTAWALCDALELRAAVAAATGDGAAAVADRLTVLACSLDLAAQPMPVLQLFGFTRAERGATTCRDDWLAQLPPAARARFAAAVAQAEASVAATSQLPAAVAVSLVLHLDSGRELRPEDLGLATRWAAWRQGFSLARWGRARAERLVAAVRTFEAATPPGEAWPARSERLRALVAADRAANADLQVPFLQAVYTCEEQRCRALAALRLLRIALAMHAGAPAPAVVDPFTGAPFEVAAGPIPVVRSACGLAREIVVVR